MFITNPRWEATRERSRHSQTHRACLRKVGAKRTQSRRPASGSSAETGRMRLEVRESLNVPATAARGAG